MAQVKLLLLLRHGKSDWAAPHQSDLDRPLAKRGVKAARSMGRQIKAMGLVPDVVITSPALRAGRTLEIAREAGDWSTTVRVDERLYGATVSRVLEVVAGEDTDTGSLMLVGHEPVWSELVEMLSGARVDFPTAALAGIELDAWTASEGNLLFLLPPRLLGDRSEA